MKHVFRGFLFAVAIATCACARREAAGAPPATLSRHLFGDPGTLDPIVTSEEHGLIVEEMIFRPLIGIDAKRRFVPSLALSWTVSPDGLLYEFRLDPKATWEDGSPVTSDDVRFTIERIRDPKVPAATWRWGFEDLAAIETPDAATVRFRFLRPYAERLLAFDLPIVSAAAYGRAKDAAETGRRPFGSGPYRLESWEPNQKITLVRRESDSKAFARVVFRIIPSSATWFQAGAQGQLDEFRVGRDQVPTAQASPDFMARHRILKVPQFMVALVVWNCRNPFLADPRARRAVALSWPRSEAALRLYPPQGAALAAGPYPPSEPENAPELAPVRQDAAAAARLLDEAGWKPGRDGVRRRGDRKASFELLFGSDHPLYRSIAEILRSSYEKIGVELVLRPLDWAAFSHRAAAGEFDAELTGRLYIPANLDPYPYFHSSQWAPNGENVGFYKNARADALMESARAEMDSGKRLELYREIHRVLVQDPPADFLWGADQYWAVAKRVDGVEVSGLGLFHFLPGPPEWRLSSSGR
jgi:peptide/nickel transport system substrate-binding protein